MKKSNLTFILVIMLLAGSTTFGYAQNTVTIGTQTWMKKNLDVSTYSDGTSIPEVTDPTEWDYLYTGAWCYYENKTANGTIYGRLYNWYAVAGIYDEASLKDKNLRKKLAPTGWHIPSDAEWNTLSTFLGGDLVAGGAMLKTGTTHWSGLPGGGRGYNASFYNVGTSGYWWSASETITSGARSRDLNYNNGLFNRDFSNKTSGFSVRCVRD